jgi:glycosyltransferase involved in cell wall biosynthesis
MVPGWTSTPLPAWKRMEAPDGAVVRVGLVATAARWKGHLAFLESLALLRDRSRVRGYVVGGSIYRTERSQIDLTELRDAAARLGVAETVGFTGYVSDPVAAMRSLDIIVHASTRPEPFGRVIIEGMAIERAVITTATGGAAELIEPGQSALAVPPDDAPALAAAIERLAAQPDLRLRLGAAGRARVERLFNRETMVGSIVRLYARVSGARPASAG